MARSFCLLLLWTAIALVLRSWNLDSKPPWTDEFATLVLSLGNSFQDVPLGEVLKINDLLAMLQPLPQAAPQGVINGLLNEDNHPPFYFVLAHLWYRLFPQNGNYLAISIGRSLPVIFGTLAVPLGYGCAKWIWGRKEERIAQFIALVMAVSPYGIFISQEARHYTFAILWGLISVACSLKAGQYLEKGKSLPIYLIILWIVVNALGIAVHFFSALLILAQGLAILFWLGRWSQQGKVNFLSGLWSLLPVMAGVATTAIVWASVIMARGYGRGMTQWIQFADMSWFSMVFGPSFQLLAAWITMFSLLPVESGQLFVVILSVLAMLAYFIWLMPVIWQGLQWGRRGEKAVSVNLLMTIFSFLVIIYLAITYIAGLDITRGARYSFNFWSLLMLMAGLGLAERGQINQANQSRDNLASPENNPLNYWQMSRQGLFLPGLILMMGIFSALTITYNLGYRKYYHPDKFLTLLNANPVAESRWIVTSHRSLVQVGELLGIAVEAQRHFPDLVPQLRFVFLPQNQPQDGATTAQLRTLLEAANEPVDLWLVNYFAPVDLPGCQADQSPRKNIIGYPYQRFQCLRPQ